MDVEVPPSAQLAVHFVCGPAPFMDAVTHALRYLGVPRKHIHIERFVSLGEDPFASSAPVEAAEGTDARRSHRPGRVIMSWVTVRVRGRSLTPPMGAL